MAIINFDSTNIAPSQTFEPIVPGEYLAMVSASEMKQTAAGTGSYLALTFTILDGEYANRNVWANLNLDNQNPKAVEIAQRDLSAICHATGRITVQDSEELHDLPLVIVTDYELDKQKQVVLDKNGRPRVRISGYKKADGAPVANVQPVSHQPAVQPAAAAQAAKPSLPWAKKAAA